MSTIALLQSQPESASYQFDNLCDVYRDYLNNYISIEVFADTHSISFEDALVLIEMGKKYHENGPVL